MKKQNTKVCDRKRGKHSSCRALHFPLQAWLFQVGCFRLVVSTEKKNEATLSFTTSILFREGGGGGACFFYFSNVFLRDIFGFAFSAN